jgi:hypothetical protein
MKKFIIWVFLSLLWTTAFIYPIYADMGTGAGMGMDMTMGQEMGTGFPSANVLLLESGGTFTLESSGYLLLEQQ